MSYGPIPHHKVIIQNLYSRKADSSKAIQYTYTTAQARSDVFYSLLFGGQVCFSAGAFFDSPIAVQVFGELCSHPKFESFCQDYGWRPLWLNTDRLSDFPCNDSSKPSIVQFITARWRDPKLSFIFFREFEAGFDDPAKMKEMKDNASAALEAEEYGGLADILAPLYEAHRIEHAIDFENIRNQRSLIDEETAQERLDYSPEFATTPAILTNSTGKWLKGLVDYLTKYKALENREATKRPAALEDFRPMMSVLERTKRLEGLSKQFSKEELDGLNSEFVRRFGDNITTMNPIHKDGPTHYGHYYPIVDFWTEAEWHQVRHRMYGAETCILSSDWQIRDIGDFDPTSLATYVADLRIDDSLRVTQEGFGEASWDVLFSTITDTKWRSLLRQIRGESDRELQRKYADAILNLLASKFSDFHFEDDGGFVSINLKRASRIGSVAAYGGLVMKYHNTLEGLLGTPLAIVAVSAAAPLSYIPSSNTAAPIFRPMLKGVKYLYGAYKGRQLRRAIVPDIYGI